MINFNEYNDEILIARGKYSTLLKEQKFQKKLLCDLNQNLISCTTLILGRMQPKFDDPLKNVDDLLNVGKAIFSKIEICTQKIISITQQMQSIYIDAYPQHESKLKTK